MVNVLTVDLEDWYCILDVGGPEIRRWGSLPARLHKPTYKILDLLERSGVRATFFVLGWIARRFPGLVADIAGAGHDIGSHGYAHELVYRQTPERFRADIRASVDAVASACGVRPTAYRAPGFSITPQTPWAFEVLVEEGFKIDASIFPARRGHGGWPGFRPCPCRILTGSGPLLEIPTTTVRVGPFRFAFSGGGYLRVLPYPLIKALARRANAADLPVVFYIHPREFDPRHPRLPMGFRRRFKSYVALASTPAKVRRLLADFEFTSLSALEPAADVEMETLRRRVVRKTEA